MLHYSPHLSTSRPAIPIPAPPTSPQPRTLSPLFVQRLRYLATRLVSGLAVLKTEGIIHADIKPENLFIQYLSACSESIPSVSSPLSSDLLSALPQDDFDVKIGDFGNAFHKTEMSKFYDKFDIQSLPYRCPEVLMGVPFGDKIDMWSLGIVLLELCLGHTLFFVTSREELFVALCEVFHASLPAPLLFAGGRYTSDLMALRDTETVTPPHPSGPSPAAPAPTSGKISFADQVAGMYDILASRGVAVQHLPGSLLHFLAALTHWDPAQRLSAPEALQHDFLTAHLAHPLTVLGTKRKHNGQMQQSVSALRNQSVRTKSPKISNTPSVTSGILLNRGQIRNRGSASLSCPEPEAQGRVGAGGRKTVLHTVVSRQDAVAGTKRRAADCEGDVSATTREMDHSRAEYKYKPARDGTVITTGESMT